MATERNPAEIARAQAINELRLAILALECGEMHSAENHAHASVAWIREIA
jgi:hypothetical protein